MEVDPRTRLFLHLFVLKYLLGYKNVRNSDGSWTEWGKLVGAPIEREIAAAAR
jgi:3-mercaptopyruvate sulfurtransferase SseA